MQKLKRIVNLTIIILMLWASTLSVQAGSFEFDAIAEKEEVNAGDIVKIDMQIDKIDAKEGINVVEANLEYDETVFESVVFKNTNEWTTSYHAEPGERKDKFIVTKLVEGITQKETIGQIQLKLKDNLGNMETNIKIKRVISNDGIELINEGNRTIKIKIAKKQNDGSNGDQNGSQNGGQNGNQNGGQNGGQSGNQNEGQNGNQNGNQNGGQSGNQNSNQNGNQNSGQNGSQNGNQNSGQNGNQNANQNGGQNGGQNGSQNKIDNTKGSLTGDNLKTGDKIVFIIIAVIVLIGINFLYFILKQKQLKNEIGRQKDRKKILILAITSVVLMIIVIFLAKDIIAYGQEETEAIIQQLKSQNKDNPESEEYLVTDKIISRVRPETSLQMLKSKVENIEVINGEDTENVKTGMVAKYEKNGRTYEISVLGDINGDGILNQIDLTREIREFVKSQKWRIEKEIEKIAGDVTFDGEINEKDINTIIHYILYDELQVKEVEKVIAPKIEVLEGIEAEEGIYLSSVTIKITQQNEETKTAKTIYEMTGSQTIEEKEINNKQEEIKLTETGIYRITSYTYGIEGNKSKGSDIILVIEAPKIKTDTEEWTNQNVIVTIEGKEDYEIEYKINDGEWKKYDKEIEIEENCEITTRLKKDDVYGAEIKKEITNIDKEKPTGKIEVTSLGSGKMVLGIEGQDARLSGIKEIRVYGKEENETEYECKATYNYEKDPNKYDLKQETLILKGLEAGTAYEIYLEVEDIAGNILNKDNEDKDNLDPDNPDKDPDNPDKDPDKEPGDEEHGGSTTITTTTEEMAKAVIIETPVEWTNENVEVAIEAGEVYKIEYKINDGEWTPYTEKFIVEENCMITAKLTDTESIQNVSEVTKEIKNIDKLEPHTFTPVVNSTTNCITMTGSTTDQEETETNGSSGIAKYYFSKDDGQTWEPTEGQTETTYLFENLTQGTIYHLQMKAVDNAGNETIAEMITKETKTVPNLTDSNTRITYSTTDPTNKDVIVTIITTVGNEYTLQYSKDKTNWYDYETAVSMSRNGDIYARVKDSTGQIGGMIKGNVANIDKLPPNLFTATTNATTNGITMTGGTTDQAETEEFASSGIAKYYFSKDDGATWEPTNGQTEMIYTFSGLTQDTMYSLKMKAVDNAGNETITNTISKATGLLPDLTAGNTTFTYHPTRLTNQDVIVNIATTEEIGALQYSKDGNNWSDYTTPVSMTQNGNIYARLWDGTNAGGATQGKVENIDKLPPNNFTPTATSTTNKIVITGSTTDQAKTATNASSGMDKYYFSKDNGATWEPTAGQTETSYTFGNLKHNTTYNLKMKAVDKVGNEKITSTVSKSTVTVPTLAEANIRMFPDKTALTKEDVIVTIESSNNNEYRVLYATTNPENESSWSEYTNPITMRQNGAVYGRLVDSVGNAGEYETLNISNIDKLAPNNFTPTATSKTDKITLTGSTTDQAKTATNASSGIDKYYFSKDNGATWEPTAGQTGTSYTFGNLKQTTTYSLKMKAVDKVGNEIITNTVTKATGSVPTLEEANIRMLPDKSALTKEDVIVTIESSKTNEYRVLYATANPENENSWSEYTNPITMRQNGAVYGRLVDSAGNIGGYATLNITNIDKLAPKPFTSSNLTATTTSNSITVNASTTDQEKTSQYACSGIGGYSFKINNGQWSAWQTSGQYTFPNLAPGTYTIKVKAKDNAGNESETEGSITKDVISLSLSSSSGKVLTGKSITVTVNGGNYGTLSCSTDNSGIATASLSGTTLTVRGTSTANGTQSTTIRVTGSKGVSTTYTIQSHKHYGSETSGGGCYSNTPIITSCTQPLQLIQKTCGKPVVSTGATWCGGTADFNSTHNSGNIDGEGVTVYADYTCRKCLKNTRVASPSVFHNTSEINAYIAQVPKTTTCIHSWYSYACPDHGGDYGSPFSTCIEKISYYTCPDHGGEYSTSTAICTSTATTYPMNCGFPQN